MTTGEARVLETDAVVFPTEVKQNNLPENSSEKPSNEIKLEEGTNNFELANRFARLKKSLRKRSASIL